MLGDITLPSILLNMTVFKVNAGKKNFQNMIKNLKQQQSIFTKKSDNVDNLLRASYIVSEKVATHSKNYSDGEFVKNCLIVVAECLCPEKRKDFDNISLSQRTITRHIEELATNIESTLKELASKFVYYSLAIDESTDITSTAQLAVFVRGIDQEFNITEEMLGLQAMKDTTTGDDIFNEVKALMTKFNLQLQNLRGFSTDGAPAMVGSTAGVSSLIKKELASNNVDMHDFTAFHCIIHQQCNLTIYYCEVRWLSKGKMLKRFYDLRDEIATFMDMKGKIIPELSDNNWVRDLAFLVDLTMHFNALTRQIKMCSLC